MKTVFVCALTQKLLLLYFLGWVNKAEIGLKVIRENFPNNLYCALKHSLYITSTSSHPEVFLRKGVLKICNKFTGRSTIPIKLQSKNTSLISHFCMGVLL